MSSRTYERHGLARGETLETFKLCQKLLSNPWVRVCPKWSTAPAFTRGVIADIGLRPKGDASGRWLLDPRPSHLYQLIGEHPPGEFDYDEWFGFSEGSDFTIRPVELRNLPPGVRAGHIFQPDHLAWEWSPFTRKLRAKTTAPLPKRFEKSIWGHNDPSRQRARRAARAEWRAEQF